MTRRRYRTPKRQPRPASMTPGTVGGTGGGTVCRNCGAALKGEYCFSCGQEADIHGRTLREYLVDISYDFLSIDGKIWQGFRDLLVYPGRLTRDYLDGRRASRPVPSRLFLVMSVLTFGLVPILLDWIGVESASSDSALLRSYDTISPMLAQLGLPEILSTDILQALRDHATVTALISVIPLAGVLALFRRPQIAMFSGHAAHAFHLTAAMLVFGLFGHLGTMAIVPTVVGIAIYGIGGYRSQDRSERRRIWRMVLWWVLAWVVAVAWLAVGIMFSTPQMPIGVTEIEIVDTMSFLMTAPLLLLFLLSIFFIGSALEIFYITRSIMAVDDVSFRIALRQGIVVTLVVVIVRTLLVVATIAAAA